MYAYLDLVRYLYVLVYLVAVVIGTGSNGGVWYSWSTTSSHNMSSGE